MSMNNKREADSISDNEFKKIKQDTPENRLKNVLRNEIIQEIKIRSSDLTTIEDRIFQTKKAIERVRQGAVAAFYSEKYKGELQPPLHPAVKDTLSGKRPIIKEEKLSDDETQNNDMAETAPKQPRYVPPKYEEKDIVQPFEPRGNQQKEKYRLIIGNVSKWIGNGADSHATHKWTIYVRCKNEKNENINVDEIFTSVVFYLHPSYKPHDVIKIDDPPFKLTRRGWGEFPLRVRFYFANELDKSLDVVHHIKLDRTHSGLETFGGETMVDAWAYGPGVSNNINAPNDVPNIPNDTSNAPLDPETKPSFLPSLSSIPFSSDISSDILSEIFGGPDDSSKASFGDFIKTDPVPIEEIDIKPLDFQLIQQNCVKMDPGGQNDYVMVPNEAIKEEIIIESDQFKNCLNELFVYDNTEVKEEIIYENDVKEIKEIINDIPTDNNCDIVSNTQNIVNGSKIDNSQKPIIICENKNISPIKLGNSLKTIKLIANKTPIKIKTNDNTNKVLVFESSKKNQLFKIVVDPKTLLNLPKPNGAKTNTSKTGQNAKAINFTLNPDKKTVGAKVQNNPPKTQKPILITTNKGGKQTLVLQRKVLPGMSLLKKADTQQNLQNTETTFKTTSSSFCLQDCPSEKVEFAVRWLVSKFPLVDTRANKDIFRSIHPYCAPSQNVFLSWPIGKQRAAEWMRAKTITKLLPKICTNIQPWSTIQVLDWCRLMGYTPKETNSGSDLCVQEPITLNFSPPDLKKIENSIKKEIIKNVNIMSNNTDTTSTIENRMYFPLPEEDQDLANFISISCQHYISKRIADEELIPDVNFPSALSVLVSAFNSIAQDLIRRSYAASVIRHNAEAPEQINENDVKNALFSREEFDLFTNEGLGEDDN